MSDSRANFKQRLQQELAKIQEGQMFSFHRTFFTNQDGVEVLSAQFNGFPAQIRLAQ